jgi:hypothetical protein
MREDWRAARAEGQRKRIIHLLEQLADEESKEQCRMCGEWFDSVAKHQPHCEH